MALIHAAVLPESAALVEQSAAGLEGLVGDGVDLIPLCLVPVGVEVLDHGVGGMDEGVASHGGLDELVVGEAVVVAFVEDEAASVDGAVGVGVGAGEERVGGVTAVHHSGIAEVIGADDMELIGEVGDGGGEPAGMELQVVGGEEEVRLGRSSIPGVDLPSVIPRTTLSTDDVVVGG